MKTQLLMLGLLSASFLWADVPFRPVHVDVVLSPRKIEARRSEGNGYAFVYKFITRTGCPVNQASNAQLYENGTPLMRVINHNEINTIGNGRFSHWYFNGVEYVRFSTIGNRPYFGQRIRFVCDRTNSVILDKALMVPGPGYQMQIGLSEFNCPASSNMNPQGSQAYLLENGRPIGIANSLHATIAQLGGGRFSHWMDNFGNVGLYFSSSDGSDPKMNTYTYELVCNQ